MDAQKQARASELMEELAELLASAENQDGSWKTFDQMELAANEVGDQYCTPAVCSDIRLGSTLAYC